METYDAVPPKKLQFNDFYCTYIFDTHSDRDRQMERFALTLTPAFSVHSNPTRNSECFRSIFDFPEFKKIIPSLKLTDSHPKMDGWKLEDYFLFWGPAYFSGAENV